MVSEMSGNKFGMGYYLDCLIGFYWYGLEWVI